ncbi:DMT family transporter [Lachnoclostridium phytofermentans]|uniref:DMT family transporter n=1 Tax=Lachnoclostridium phytofermentans TaxID=66219 RepID=UPI0004953D11|nr:DMT family transporter [Lachnoclostridium phytofermentans]
MTTLLLILSITFFILQSVSMKFIKAETLPEKMLIHGSFTLVAGIGMCLFLFLSKEPFTFSKNTVLFGILFGFLFAFTILFYNLAINSGPLSYTAFYFSSSMLLPTLFGLLFLKEELRWTLIVAIMLFLIAFYFLNVTKESKDESASSTQRKQKRQWLLYCILTFIGNGCLAIVQKLHQHLQHGTEASGLMLLGFAFASLCYFIAYPVVKQSSSNKGSIILSPKKKAKENLIPILFLAAGSLLGNLLLTSLAGKIPSSYLFPLVQGSIILGITIISTLFFHEKLSTRGKIGILLGVLAIVFINI